MKKTQYFFMTLLTTFSLAFGQMTVSGTVTDAVTGEGLIGANVVVAGTDMGTAAGEGGSFTISNVSSGATLNISMIGYASQSVPASESVTVALQPSAVGFDALVVSATRVPVRKLQTTTAVTIRGEEGLKRIQPEGLSEAVQGTPGIYASQSQGRFRGLIFTRGFPDGGGNGLVYTGMLVDGLPTLATTARPPDFALGMDTGFDRVEVVRGSAATLFGRSSAAGVVNLINKVGGETTKGSASLTTYSDNTGRGGPGKDIKLDFNLNGPLSDQLRYNIAGYYVKDEGFRDLGFPDVGGQVRGNVDYLMGDKGSVRVYGSLVDVSIQNMIDIPFVVETQEPKDGWETTHSFYNSQLDGIDFPVTNKDGKSETRLGKAMNKDGNYARGYMGGLSIDYNLSDALSLTSRTRYQNYDHGTKFNLGVSGYYTDAPFSHIRVLIDGDGNDTDFMQELRATYTMDMGGMKHSFSGGMFTSTGWYSPVTYSLVGGMLSNESQEKANFATFGPPRGGQARIDEYEITATSFFVGDEISAMDDKLKVNVGLRTDKVDMDLSGFYSLAEGQSQIKNRKESHDDMSYSAGFNYLVDDRSAAYGNYLRAFKMPDYSAYSPVDPNSLVDNPDITDNEIINSMEVGYRTAFGDMTVDGALFTTKIDNRLATVYEGAVAVQRPLGMNDMSGFEVGLTYAPRSVVGLVAQASFTSQSTKFGDNFYVPVTTADLSGDMMGLKASKVGGVDVIDVKGKQVPRVPNTVANFSVAYQTDSYGANVYVNHFGGRYADALNLIEQEAITNVSAGAYYRMPIGDGALRVSLQLKNILNTNKALRQLYVTDNDASLAWAQKFKAGTADRSKTYFMGIPYLPSRMLLTMAYEF